MDMGRFSIQAAVGRLKTRCGKRNSGRYLCKAKQTRTYIHVIQSLFI